MKDPQLFEKAISWAKSRGFSQIKANVDDYEQPAKFTKTGDPEPFIPDLTGLRLGGKSYIEIAMKPEDSKRQLSKWKLLSSLAAVKSGKLFLLAPKGHKAFVEKTIKQNNINATVASI